MINFIKLFLTHFTYLALILILFAAGLGVPIPEDIPLITSGYMCNPQASVVQAISDDAEGEPKPEPVVQHHVKQPRVPKLWLMMIAGMVGVLGGDTIVYTIGRRGVHGEHFVARHLRKVLNSKRRGRLEAHFVKHGNLTVFLARFLPGARSIVFAMAGISKMGYGRFMLIDGMAAAISVPTFIFVGYHFAADLDGVFAWVHRVKHIVTPIGIGLMVMGIALYIVRRRRRKQMEACLVVPEGPIAPNKMVERVGDERTENRRGGSF